jgi:pimeloyl-ACP methyl ester carboxylesterase
MHSLITDLESRAELHPISHAGTSVAWRRFGSGPHLVLLHGGHGSWLHWARNVEALAREHTLWLPDMPGFGASESLVGDPHAPDRMERLVEAMQVTLDALVGADTEIDLGGFSFGGLAAAMLGAARGRIRRMAFVGVGGHGGPRRQSIDLVDWRLPDRAARVAALRQNLVPFMLHDERNSDDLALDVHEWSCVTTRFRSKPIALAGGLPHALEGITAPILFLWGEHDVTAIPEEIGPKLLQGRANRESRIIRDSGHWAQFEKTDAVNAQLLEWFKPT